MRISLTNATTSPLRIALYLVLTLVPACGSGSGRNGGSSGGASGAAGSADGGATAGSTASADGGGAGSRGTAGAGGTGGGLGELGGQGGTALACAACTAPNVDVVACPANLDAGVFCAQPAACCAGDQQWHCQCTTMSCTWSNYCSPGAGGGGSDAAACFPLFHACTTNDQCCAPNRCINITGQPECQQEGPAAAILQAQRDLVP